MEESAGLGSHQKKRSSCPRWPRTPIELSSLGIRVSYRILSVSRIAHRKIHPGVKVVSQPVEGFGVCVQPLCGCLFSQTLFRVPQPKETSNVVPAFHVTSKKKRASFQGRSPRSDAAGGFKPHRDLLPGKLFSEGRARRLPRLPSGQSGPDCRDAKESPAWAFQVPCGTRAHPLMRLPASWPRRLLSGTALTGVTCGSDAAFMGHFPGGWAEGPRAKRR